MRLRSKLFISLAPIFMTLLTVVSIFLFDILSNSLGKEIDRSSESAQAQALIKIDEHFRSSQSDSDFMSNIQSVRELIKGKTLNKTLGLQEVIVSTFTQLKKSKPQYKEMFLLDSENKVVFSHSEDVFYNPDVDLGWLTKSTTLSHKDDESPIVNTTLGTRIYFINDILDLEGSTIGKVILTQDTIALSVISYTFSPNGDDHVIFTSNTNEPMHSLTPITEALFNAYSAQPEKHTNLVDKTHWKTVVSNQNFGNIITFTNADTLHVGLSVMKSRSVFVTIIAMIIFVTIIYFVVNIIVINPIKQVEAAALSITKTSHFRKLPDDRKDEIGNLNATFNNMSQTLQSRQAEIEHLAFYDTKTKLHNEQFLLNELKKETEIKLNKGLAVWCVVLKNFDVISDTNGIFVANRALEEVAINIQTKVKALCEKHGVFYRNTTIARSEGNKFIMCASLPSGSNEIGHLFAAQLSTLFKLPILVDGNDFYLDVCIGWAQGKGTGIQIYENATLATRHARNNNISILKYNSSLTIEVMQKKEMSDNIKNAIKSNEFTLYYQAKYAVEDPTYPSQFEALIRWEHDGVFISPGIFIEFAEKAGIISLIDYWVIENVIKDISRMQSLDMKDFCVSFNVSGERVCEDKFYNELKTLIEKYNINPKHVQIEITEHSLIDDINKSIENIRKIKSLGVSVALDDFGTGHSSLGYLNVLPIDTLKIDRCFVSNVDTVEHKLILLTHIASLGKKLKLKVVGEGVETKEEFEILKKVGCDLVQGYYFQRPAPFNEIIKLRKQTETII